MGCVGPKSVIEVRDGMTFLDLSVRQIEVSSAFPPPSPPSCMLELICSFFARIAVLAPQLCQ